MSGHGYGYGFGVGPSLSGGASGPPVSGLYSHIDVENLTTFDDSGNDYVDYYTSAGGSYSGNWDGTDAGVAAHQYDPPLNKLNNIVTPRYYKPFGGVVPYALASEQGPWDNASAVG
jgi:hypothetical protein